MLIFLVLLGAAFNITQSAPAMPSTNIPVDPLAPFNCNTPVANCDNPTRHRTMQEIILSCFTTIFSCTWVSMHPNVPDPRNSGWKNFTMRMRILLWALIGPEFITIWAFRQRMGAARHAKAYNIKFGLKPQSRSMIDCIRDWFHAPSDKNTDSAWTLTHGFLLEMQGMVFLKDGQPLNHPVTDQSRSQVSELRRRGKDEEAAKLEKLCDFEELRRSFYPGLFLHLDQLSDRINIPSEAEITDKSRGDFFSKLVVVIQTTWFIVQCIARWLLQLPVTELEVITLAFASLNLITYILWWNKPQNLRIAFPVHETSEPHETYGQRTEDQSQPVEENVAGQYPKCSGPSIHDQTSPTTQIVTQHQQHYASPHTHIAIRVLVYLFSTLLTVIRVLCQAFQMLLIATNPLPAYFIMIGDNFLGLGSPDVQAAFYSFIGGTEEEKLVSFGLGSVGILFGGTHLLPFWLSSFPSEHDRWLWVVSASWLLVQSTLVSFSIPISNRLPFMLECLFVPLIFLSHILGFLTYAAARFILIYAAFNNLRSSPPSVFSNIEWSTFVPHF